jgi:serine phosphatase RsbU (regulator of sigma subunit)
MAAYSTNLGRGIVLVYGLGLMGFALIFYKLFHPLLISRAVKTDWGDRWKAKQAAQRDRSEYERLLSVMTEMEQKAKDSQKRIADYEARQTELMATQKDQQAEKAASQKTRQKELQDLEEERKELLRFSDAKNDLEKQLEDAQARIRNQEHYQEGMRKEVKVAQQIQHALLPKEYPQIEGFQIGSSYRAASEVGGDYYDFIWVDPTTLGIAVGDVAGKGVPGSMVMAMIRTAMRLEAQKNKSPASVLLKVHQHVNGDMKRGMFATMFYIVLDSRNRSISYASAGHNPMILYRRSTDEVYFLKPKGFPLGIDLPDESLFAKTLALQKLKLQKDDLLLIYTDGVTEAMNAKNEQFGDDRLIQSIRDSAHLSAPEVVQKIEADIASFVRDAEQSDDVTIVAIKENMQAEDVIYKFRKNLLNLVDEEGLSIAEACRQANVSPQTYYYYKAIHDKKGDAGLKPIFPKKRAVVHELSLDQRNAVLSVVKSNPELGAGQIVEFLKRVQRPPLKLESKVVAEFLTRKGLGDAKERKVFAANEIDTV